ncbi:MAG: hypothetical protein FOGNACKC_00973 [Anaerolineae bacterium]|nr:hypothetical protein [Anaerolineae bacterium]
MAYIKSEAEFGSARKRAFLEMILGLFTGHNVHLLSFDEVADKLRLTQSIYRGLHDVPLKNIVGSTGRYDDFTRQFLPRTSDKRDKERWRNIYTLAVTGKGFPQIDVYKVDQAYFVKDGNHRVSVARELGWETIQAYVTELPTSISLGPEAGRSDLLIKQEAAYFLDRTQLHKTRPESKTSIEFTELGWYQRLLKHIHLHRFLLGQAGMPDVSIEEASADWYDKVYMPIIEAVRQSEVIKHFPGRSESDLYAWLVENQTRLRQRHSFEEIALSESAREFLETVLK